MSLYWLTTSKDSEGEPRDSTKSTRPNQPDPTETSTSRALSGAFLRLTRPLGSLGHADVAESAGQASE